MNPPNGALAAEATAALIDAVAECLASFVSDHITRLSTLDVDVARFAGLAGDAVLFGGKRLRPVFAYWGWRGAAGAGDRVADVVPALAALEMLHGFALVHDDVMDESPFRRGRPSVHAAFTARQRVVAPPATAERFGRNAAILAGDLCLVWADELLARAAVPGDTILRARAVYDRMREETIVGQYLDVLGEASTEWSLGRAMRVNLLKTAAYSVVRPLHFGAALAGAECWSERPEALTGDPLTDAYTRYGVAVGEAFQLRDDLLDAYGDPAATGKPAGDDLARGRPTVLLELARRRATAGLRAEIERELSTGAPADTARLGVLLTETGAPAQVEKMIKGRTLAALAALENMPVDPTVRTALAHLAVAAGDRVV